MPKKTSILKGGATCEGSKMNKKERAVLPSVDVLSHVFFTDQLSGPILMKRQPEAELSDFCTLSTKKTEFAKK